MMLPVVNMSRFLFMRGHPRSITTSAILRLKEVQETQKGNKIIVEGVSVKSPREGNLAVPPPESREEACPLCRLGLKRLSFSDVLILSQFLQPNGKIMSLKDSKLCSRQYRLVSLCIQRAQDCKLLPRPKDYPVTGPWDLMNTYHEWPSRRRDQPMKVVQPYYWKKVDFRKGE